MLAYFSVRDFIAKLGFPSPEKKGVRPNPNYYPAVEELYPAFERYAEDPSIYTDFRALIRDIIPSLKKVAV